MIHRKTARLTAIGAGVITCGLTLVTMSAASPGAPASPEAATAATATAPTATATAPTFPGANASPGVGARVLAARDPFSSCERRLERGPRSRPAMAIVGASYTAGVGPGKPTLAWSALLARSMHWNAVIYGVPGVGYVALGGRGLGPVARMLDAERLHHLDPSLVIVQAGYNDTAVSPAVERQRVRQVIALIRARAPRARIALLTVFTAPSRHIPAAYYRTDREIVSAARAADPHVIIMDPLLGRWKFQHVDNRLLHPTAAGDVWIARKTEAILRGHGVFPVPPSTLAPVICDISVSGGPPRPQAKLPGRASDA